MSASPVKDSLGRACVPACIDCQELEKCARFGCGAAALLRMNERRCKGAFLNIDNGNGTGHTFECILEAGHAGPHGALGDGGKRLRWSGAPAAAAPPPRLPQSKRPSIEVPNS